MRQHQLQREVPVVTAGAPLMAPVQGPSMCRAQFGQIGQIAQRPALLPASEAMMILYGHCSLEGLSRAPGDAGHLIVREEWQQWVPFFFPIPRCPAPLLCPGQGTW